MAGMLTAAVAMSAGDPRDAELRHREHTEIWACAYEAGEAAGFARAVADFKRAQTGAVADLELYFRRWDGKPREQFGEPRPGDFPGREAHRG
jgi:hypothetical protein